MTHNERLDFLLAYLLEEDPKYKTISVPKNYREKKDLLNRLLKVRPVTSFSREFREIYTGYLLEENRRMNLISIQDLTPVQPHVYLWDGDPQYLKTDARVIGSHEPAQKIEQNVRVEKINDPSYSHVIYATSPSLSSKFTSHEYNAIYQCFWDSLEAAMANSCRTIAFDTFVQAQDHNYPVEIVAQIAINSVNEFRRRTRKSFDVVFNVPQKDDYMVYERLLGKKFM